MKKYWSDAAIAACLSAWGTIVPLSIASANTAIPTGAIEQLSLDQQTALENGDIIITGTDGDYVARMVVDASVDDLWSVLTDYNNFTEFLPNIVSSTVVESTGNNYVVEQVSKQRVFLFDIESRLLTENIQTEKQRVDFRLIEGDLALFQGYWTIEPISSTVEGNRDRLLITQSVEVQPERGTPEAMFYDIFKSALEKTLTAIREEVDRRKSL
ncbi:MAG: cyclase/dehydrase [Cyanobacteria bacterium J055]|nr:MAG: cyclase/dehydrase [Cyanobacteria bacterium J055]